MKYGKPLLILAMCSSLVLTVGGVSAGDQPDHDHEHEQEHRQHGAHVHGIGQLNLVLEGPELYLEFDSPAANIVGFEHAPSTEADHAALDKAVVILRDGNRLFQFNAAAGCRLEDVEIDSVLFDEDHDKPGHEHKEGHQHTAKTASEPEEQEQEGETHSDIQANYHFECAEPAQLEQLTVALFEVFPGTERLKVQFVIDDRQGGGELTATNRVMTF